MNTPTDRAIVDLTDMAQAMHARLCESPDIYEALERQASLWRQLVPALPHSAALEAMRRLPALRDWSPVTASRFIPETADPFYWEYLSPEDSQKRTQDALLWFDREMQVHHEKATHEARVRKIRGQPLRSETSVPLEIRESIAQIVREVVAAELPAVLRAFAGK